MEFIKDKEFFQILFEAIPAVTLIVNASGRVYGINSSAKAVFNVDENEVYLKKGGGVFHCIHAIENSEVCGTEAVCKECIVRNTAIQAIEGNHIKRAKGKLVVKLNGKLKDLHLLVSASPLKYKGEQLAVIILEDISKIAELQGLLPICSHCKNILNEKGYWERLEKYIETHSEAMFTHNICPQCLEELYPNLHECK